MSLVRAKKPQKKKKKWFLKIKNKNEEIKSELNCVGTTENVAHSLALASNIASFQVSPYSRNYVGGIYLPCSGNKHAAI